ncbi:putative cold shock protein [Gordonia hirsuta DSM 44140 = NBRC 16056]|uniref:Putative cold shock protein n=1 Tax=Gordonia hirsuta DSM 44140 = NBRC 16056 TaxID=1121927 RepID=L7LAQ3_9ACTN|nr:putative cold shock protein [Gordonia hirsuta DSM 44140 = NBRC 16056]
MVSVSGKVVHYDPNRGFGFLSPESGGDDVFLHINDLQGIDEGQLRPGAKVEFDVEDTDRGAKATNLKVTEEAPPGESPAVERAQRREDNRRSFGDRDDRRGGRDDRRGGFDRRDDRRGGFDRRDDRDRDRGPRRSPHAGTPLFNEITELLLDSAPDLTARQITSIRNKMMDLASTRGWTNN